LAPLTSSRLDLPSMLAWFAACGVDGLLMLV